MNITLKKHMDKETRRKIKILYNSAFPAEERAPFLMLSLKANSGKGDLFAAEDNGKFIGMVYIISREDLAYLFYLAVEGNERGKGYGGKIISAVKEKYRGKRIFLAREQLDESADNYSQRVVRRKFYLSNGFEDLKCHIKEGKVIYDVMSIGGKVSAAEYDALITMWSGRLIRKLFDMRIIENE